MGRCEDARASVVSGSIPFEDFRSRMRVVPNDAGSCTVEWTATFEAPPDAEDQLRGLIQGVYDEVLENLAMTGPPTTT